MTSDAVFAILTSLSIALAGICDWLLVFPIDIVKTILQSNTKPNPPRVGQIIRTILAERGAAGFYFGLAPALIRAVPANIACFGAVEATHAMINRYNCI